MKRNPHLDALRGVAILLILAWHLVGPWARSHSPMLSRLLSTSWSGVDLFFVLSGFLIGNILLDNRLSPNYYMTFYTRRALRILPLYALLIMVLLLAVGSPKDILPYITFTQNVTWSMNDKFGPEILAPTWSLAVEEQFYLILSLLVRLVSPARLPVVLIGGVVVAPLCRIIMLLLALPHAAYMLLPCRADALFLGVLVAYVMRPDTRPEFFVKRKSFLRYTAILLGVGFVTLSLVDLTVLDWRMVTFGYTVIDLFYACILLLVLVKGSKLRTAEKPLIWCGLAAYSMYLFHEPLWVIVFHPIGHGPLPFVGAVLSIGAVGAFCWLFIERPLIAYGHKWHTYKKAEIAVALRGRDTTAAAVLENECDMDPR